MKNGIFVILLAFCFCNQALAQLPKIPHLKTNRAVNDLGIKIGEKQTFSIDLKKDVYYTIITQQQGIDLVVSLFDNSGKLIQEVDSPNGMFGPEKILYSPDSSGQFIISIKPLEEKSNAQQGRYSVALNEIPGMLKKLSSEQMLQDFELLQNAYYETRIGLWYNSRTQFDSVCNIQKGKIRDRMSALDFYRIIAPVVAYTKEGHSNIKVSDEVSAYLKQEGTYFPFCVKILNGKVYLLNDIENFKTKGYIVSRINGESINDILGKFLSIEPADGYNITSKYRWIEAAFSKYYTRYFAPAKSFKLVLIDPKDNNEVVYSNIPACNFKEFGKISAEVANTIPNYGYKEAATFSIDLDAGVAVLTVNSFSLDSYKNRREGFRNFLVETFKAISGAKIKNLIIDIRKNEGGEQGMEDHLLSYLINRDYEKYKYVEIPAFTYSFLEYTDYKNEADILKKELTEDFYRANDGRFLNRDGHYEGESPNSNNFQGNIYILINGLTFSGGSEFAALAKNYTSAKFIGEETGGGYYGNSSGTFLKLTLPNSGITARVPLCKFVVSAKETGIPFGHGIMPDYFVQPSIDEYLKGFDSEMEYAKNLIGKQP